MVVLKIAVSKHFWPFISNIFELFIAKIEVRFGVRSLLRKPPISFIRFFKLCICCWIFSYCNISKTLFKLMLPSYSDFQNDQQFFSLFYSDSAANFMRESLNLGQLGTHRADATNSRRELCT